MRLRERASAWAGAAVLAHQIIYTFTVTTLFNEPLI